MIPNKYCEKTNKYAGMLEVYEIKHHQIEQIKNLIKAMCYTTRTMSSLCLNYLYARTSCHLHIPTERDSVLLYKELLVK